MAEKNKKRGQNFTADEKERLINLISGYTSTILNKKTDGTTNLAKQQAWSRLTSAFNAGGLNNRTKESLIRIWDKLKGEAKLYSASNKESTTGTGGGPARYSNKDPILSRVCDLLGRGCTGIEDINDCDADADAPPLPAPNGIVDTPDWLPSTLQSGYSTQLEYVVLNTQESNIVPVEFLGLAEEPQPQQDITATSLFPEASQSEAHDALHLPAAEAPQLPASEAPQLPASEAPQLPPAEAPQLQLSTPLAWSSRRRPVLRPTNDRREEAARSLQCLHSKRLEVEKRQLESVEAERREKKNLYDLECERLKLQLDQERLKLQQQEMQLQLHQVRSKQEEEIFKVNLQIRQEILSQLKGRVLQPNDPLLHQK